MNSDPSTGAGPDDMGDDEQETEVAEWQQYIEDPPENFAITEDNDDDAAQAQDWADRHPQAAAAPDQDDTPAEESAIHEVPGRLAAGGERRTAGRETGMETGPAGE